MWLSRLLCEITTETEIPVFMVDNMSTLKLVKNFIFPKRSKHIDVRYFFIRDKVEHGSLTVDHIASNEQVADILAKPLTKDGFQRLQNVLSVSDILTGTFYGGLLHSKINSLFSISVLCMLATGLVSVYILSCFCGVV